MSIKKMFAASCIAVFFFIALYNVYSMYQDRRQVALQAEAERQELIEKQKQNRREAQQLAKDKRLADNERREIEKVEREEKLLDAKVANEQRLVQYDLLKQARKDTKENERLQRRIEAARKLNNPEALPKKIIEGIQQATYLTIRNNPKDYIGNYKSGSLLSQRAGKLTSGGANGLMLFAMVSTDLKAIEEVIQIGHDINTKNKTGHTALMFASAYNEAEVIEYLLSKKDIDISTREYITEGNALHVAARYNPKPEIFDVLIKHGFDIESRDNDGNTPLLIATKYNNNLQVVERLVELGADVKASDKTGNVAYSYALERMQKHASGGRFEDIGKEYEDSVLEILHL